VSASISLMYGGYDVRQPLGRSPELGFKINLRARNITAGTHVYIPRMNCEVNLYSAGDLEASSRSDGVFLGFISILEPVFTDAKETSVCNAYVPISGSAMEKMLSIRSKGRLVCFEITCEGLYFVYESKNGYYHLRGKDNFKGRVEKMLPTAESTRYITLTTEEFTEIVKELKHFELLRVEVPVYMTDVPPESHISKALSLLKSAGEKLTHGDCTGALLDVRNAIANHLTETQDKERVLKSDIKQRFIEKVPSQAIDTYKESLVHFEKSVTSTLARIHKFVHEDSDKLKLAPLREDVELAYFETLHAARYLSQRIA